MDQMLPSLFVFASSPGVTRPKHSGYSKYSGRVNENSGYILQSAILFLSKKILSKILSSGFTRYTQNPKIDYLFSLEK
jgi:hypothetical protein